VVGTFRETGSGVKLDRAKRRKVMALAQARQIDAVLVTEPSRWGRSTTDLLATLKVAILLVACPKRQCGDGRAVALQLGCRQLSRLAPVDTSDRFWANVLPELPVEGGARNAVESGGVL
jgi:Resolvase, N terminal domain